MKDLHYILLLMFGTFSFYAESTCADNQNRLSATDQELHIAQGQFEDQENLKTEAFAAVRTIAPHCDIVTLCCTESNNYWRAHDKLISTAKSSPKIQTDAYRKASVASEAYMRRLCEVGAKQHKNLSLLKQKQLGCSIL